MPLAILLVFILLPHSSFILLWVFLPLTFLQAFILMSPNIISYCTSRHKGATFCFQSGSFLAAFQFCLSSLFYSPVPYCFTFPSVLHPNATMQSLNYPTYHVTNTIGHFRVDLCQEHIFQSESCCIAFHLKLK